MEKCSCDWLDMGPRCEACVAQCSSRGHPVSSGPSNGRICMCGAGPKAPEIPMGSEPYRRGYEAGYNAALKQGDDSA